MSERQPEVGDVWRYKNARWFEEEVCCVSPTGVATNGGYYTRAEFTDKFEFVRGGQGE